MKILEIIIIVGIFVLFYRVLFDLFAYIKGLVISKPQKLEKKTFYCLGILLIFIAVGLFYFDKKMILLLRAVIFIAVSVLILFILIELILSLFSVSYLKSKKQTIIDSADNKSFTISNGMKKTQYYWNEIQDIKFDKEPFRLTIFAKRKLTFDEKTQNRYLLLKHIPLGFSSFDYTYRDSFFVNLKPCIVCGTIALQDDECLLCGCVSWSADLEKNYSSYEEYIIENQLDIFATIDENEKFNNFKINDKNFDSDPNWKPKVTKEEVLAFSKKEYWDWEEE